ncbi:MAG: SdrD B-like domain-containing protein [Caldilineaceae bacterium]
MSLNPPTGVDGSAPGEWGIVEAVVTIPAHASWVAFQLESEADQNGESGSWVGGGVFIILPPAAIGDRVWLDMDRNGIQDMGEPGMADVPVTLRDGAGNMVAATTTGADGLYGFDQLVTGAALRIRPRARRLCLHGPRTWRPVPRAMRATATPIPSPA